MIEIFSKNYKKATKDVEAHTCNCHSDDPNHVCNCHSEDPNHVCNCHSDKTADKTEHKIDPNNLVGEKFGDYVVIDGSERDGSGHKLWLCVCPQCGDFFRTTSYELLKGRKKTTCSTCHNPCTMTSCATTKATPKTVAVSKIKIPPQRSTNVILIEEKTDLLAMPVYYTIAHCIPADLTIYGETARRIDQFYNLINEIKSDYELWGGEPEKGDVSYVKNVITLFATARKHMRPTLADLEECITKLAQFCVDSKIEYLALPRIGCGHNGLSWDEVKPMIQEAFEKAYASSNLSINITICYQ